MAVVAVAVAALLDKVMMAEEMVACQVRKVHRVRQTSVAVLAEEPQCQDVAPQVTA